jgi:hypothetical protein
MAEIYPLTPALSPQGGEGEREPIFVLFKTCVRLGISGRYLAKTPRSVPSPYGRSDVSGGLG